MGCKPQLSLHPLPLSCLPTCLQHWDHFWAAMGGWEGELRKGPRPPWPVETFTGAPQVHELVAGCDTLYSASLGLPGPSILTWTLELGNLFDFPPNALGLMEGGGPQPPLAPHSVDSCRLPPGPLG